MSDEYRDRLTAPAHGPDPSNTEVEKLIEALDADDNVYALVLQDQGDLRETAPVGEDTEGE